MTDKIKFTINGEESVLAVDDGMTMRVGSVSPSMELTVGTVVPSKIAPPKIVFTSQSSGPVMTIHPDGNITLGDDAKPTEAAAECINAMASMIQNLISNAVQAERAAVAKWLMSYGERQTADSITRGDHLK